MAQAPVQIQNYLKNVDFPARRDGILREARNSDAPKEVLEGLQRLPDREYRSAEQVNEEMGRVQTTTTKGATGGTGGASTGRTESTSKAGQEIGKKNR